MRRCAGTRTETRSRGSSGARATGKLEVVRPYLDAAEKAGQSKVVAIGEAREFQ